MFSIESERKDFLKNLHISDEDFRSAYTSWETLSKIYDDYSSIYDQLNIIAKDCALVLQECENVHSLNFRVKVKEHLIEKVIRKNRENYESMMKSRDLSVDSFKKAIIDETNYKQLITDIIGIRLVLLYKEDWDSVHDYIIEKYGSIIKEKYAYYVLGDDTEPYIRKGVDPREKPEYRSVHYILQFPIGFAEVQVRTLAEEVWGEIDHNLRYPYKRSNSMLNRYMSLMSYISHYIDRMASFVKGHIKDFSDSSTFISNNEVYNNILAEIKKIEGNEEVVENIRGMILSSSEFQELGDMRDLMSSFYIKELEGIDYDGNDQEN